MVVDGHVEQIDKDRYSEGMEHIVAQCLQQVLCCTLYVHNFDEPWIYYNHLVIRINNSTWFHYRIQNNDRVPVSFCTTRYYVIFPSQYKLLFLLSRFLCFKYDEFNYVVIPRSYCRTLDAELEEIAGPVAKRRTHTRSSSDSNDDSKVNVSSAEAEVSWTCSIMFTILLYGTV